MFGILALMLAAAGPSNTCVAAAERLLGFVVEEANGTRHAGQIAESIATPHARALKLKEMAGGLREEQCAFLLVAPDSAVRALAVSVLPERSGN